MTAARLKEKPKSILELSDAERIDRIRHEYWIGYPRARQILANLEDLLTYPQKHRMPNRLIIGETNNGKTMIVTRFLKLHPEYDNPDGDGITLPVLGIQAPPTPDESRFYNTILEKLYAPYKPSDRVDAKQFQAITTFRRIKTRMLIIDEIHHILAGNLNKQRSFLNTIKYLGNELQIPIIGVGTRDAFNALQSDPQLSNRFEPAILHRWQMNNEYIKLLASFEQWIPLKKPSNLVESALAIKLLSMSEGTIGELSAIISRASIKAIETGAECITAKLLDSTDWIRPSERKWGAKKIA